MPTGSPLPLKELVSSWKAIRACDLGCHTPELSPPTTQSLPLPSVLGDMRGTQLCALSPAPQTSDRTLHLLHPDFSLCTLSLLGDPSPKLYCFHESSAGPSIKRGHASRSGYKILKLTGVSDIKENNPMTLLSCPLLPNPLLLSRNSFQNHHLNILFIVGHYHPSIFLLL